MKRYVDQDKVIDALLNLDVTHRVSWRDAVIDMIDAMPSVQPEYYDYSDIDDVWKFYAEEQDINLTDGAKQLKDAMWAGYRKGKQDAHLEQRWIPCSERLPEDGSACLISLKSPFAEWVSHAIFSMNGDIEYFEDKTGEGGFYSYDSEYGYYKREGVIAWMPLPEPYEGVSE